MPNYNAVQKRHRSINAQLENVLPEKLGRHIEQITINSESIQQN